MPVHEIQPANRVCFDAELIRRYDRNGPRYTSYPTAVEFHPGCGVTQYQQAAARSNQPGKPLSIYVHIPFCTSPCFYCGCNKVITRDTGRAEIYLHYLFRELALQASLFDRSRVVEQLHLGGGTPTFLSLEQMARLMAQLQTHFNMSTDADRREFSIEIDPRTLLPETLPTLAQLGFNLRLSLGIPGF
jgi:oxygen-independent coproporphyrinogen-3 oxidase